MHSGNFVSPSIHLSSFIDSDLLIYAAEEQNVFIFFLDFSPYSWDNLFFSIPVWA